MDKYASFNRFASLSMDLISCMTDMHESVKTLASDPSQENVEKLAQSAKNFEEISEAYKSSVFSSAREIAGEELDEVEGLQDENGVRIS